MIKKIISIFLILIPINAFALIGMNINKKIKIFFVIQIYYPSNISLASKFNCNSFHLSYPVVGTLNG